jgi:hypothetical protein
MRKMLFRMSKEGVQVLLHSGRSFVGDGLLQSIGNPKQLTMLCIDLGQENLVLLAPFEMPHIAF